MTPRYRIIYWSTAEKHGKLKPYGTEDYDSMPDVLSAESKLIRDPEIYRIEIWMQCGVYDQSEEQKDERVPG
jgi:hypothetical protein